LQKSPYKKFCSCLKAIYSPNEYYFITIQKYVKRFAEKIFFILILLYVFYKKNKSF